jgi:hypothetical protein
MALKQDKKKTWWFQEMLFFKKCLQKLKKMFHHVAQQKKQPAYCDPTQGSTRTASLKKEPSRARSPHHGIGGFVGGNHYGFSTSTRR